MNRALIGIVLLAGAAVLGSACADPERPVGAEAREVRFGQTRLKLEDRDGKCHAMTRGEEGGQGDLMLDIPWPCRFHTDTAGNIRTLSSAGFSYVLVESSRRMPSPSRDCETYLRSVRSKGDRVELSPHTERVASCPPFQWDAIVFTELFD